MNFEGFKNPIGAEQIDAEERLKKEMEAQEELEKKEGIPDGWSELPLKRINELIEEEEGEMGSLTERLSQSSEGSEEERNLRWKLRQVEDRLAEYKKFRENRLSGKTAEGHMRIKWMESKNDKPE